MIRMLFLIFQEFQVCKLFPRTPWHFPSGLKIDLDVLRKLTNQVCLVCNSVSVHLFAVSRFERSASSSSPFWTVDEGGRSGVLFFFKNCSYSRAMLSKSILIPRSFIFWRKTIEANRSGSISIILAWSRLFKRVEFPFLVEVSASFRSRGFFIEVWETLSLGLPMPRIDIR